MRILVLAAVAFCFALSSYSLAQGKGLALLVVFPDYPIDTDTVYGYTKKVGHAGVLLIDEKGLTKYYEFGRYDSEKRGRVHQRIIPNVIMKKGLPTTASLAKILRTLSDVSGKKGRIRAARFLSLNFKAMNRLATQKKNESDPKNVNFKKQRKKYSVTGFNCAHFAESIILKGHPRIDRPKILNPTPRNFVDEYIEEGNAEVLYDRKTGKLTIGQSDESDAKKSKD